MKIANLSDPHLKSVNPRNRIDDYQETVFNKFEFLLNYCDDNGIEIINCSGDLFDSPRSSLGFVKRVIDTLKNYKVKLYSVSGNHDQYFRSKDLTNTPLGLLESAGVLTLLGEDPVVFGDVHLYGESWETSTPKIIDPSKVNILSVHKMVIRNDKIWHDQTEYTTAGSLLKNNDFDLICSGDNHQTFTETYKGKKLVNCGSMMRSTVAQKDHKPSFFVYDTDTKKLEQVFFPIRPFEEVSLISEHEESKEMNQKLNDYRLALNDGIDSSGLDFEKNMIEYMRVNNIEGNIKQILEECVNG